MVIPPKSRKSSSTELTWDEQHPFSYRFNSKVVTELQMAIKKAKEIDNDTKNCPKYAPGKKAK